MIQISNQAELDAAIARGATRVEIVENCTLSVRNGCVQLVVRGSLSPTVEAHWSSQPRVEAWGSSQPRVEAWGSSQPRVEAWGASQPHVVAYESSQPRVEAWESSQPRVDARDSSQPRVVAHGSSQPLVVAYESSQPRVVAHGSSQPHVVAWESSQPHVVARESSQPHVVAWESSQPRVDARDSSQPRVVAHGSSQPRVDARDSSQPRVEAWGSSQPTVDARGCVMLRLSGRGVTAVASAKVAVYLHGGATCAGGVQIVDETPRTIQEWSDKFGTEIRDGCVVLAKAVRNDFRSERGASYVPGKIAEAADWDGGEKECGGGLHFCASPGESRGFDSSATRFVRVLCPIDCVAVHHSPEHPNKVKAQRCWCECEIDEFGDAIGDVFAMPADFGAAKPNTEAAATDAAEESPAEPAK